MSIFEKIKNWFYPPRTTADQQSSYPDLAPINAEEVAFKYNLRTEGARLGAGNVPAVDTNGPVGAEAAAILEVETARLSYQAWGSHRLNSLDGQIDNCDIRHEINAALVADQTFKNKAVNLLNEKKDTLNLLAQSVNDTAKELNDFKKLNKLDRLSKAPSQSEKILLWSILFVILFLESIVNAQFFKDGLAGGFLDGVIMAGIFASINIGFAVFIGWKLIPSINSIINLKKLTGYFGILMWLIFAITLALMIAHYRNALEANSIEPHVEAWTILFSTPFHLGNLKALLLFKLSLVFSLFALIDGYKLDDSYPGFGAITRKHLEAQDNYATEINDVLKLLEDLKKEQLDKVNDTVARTSGVTATLATLINDKESASQRLNAAMTYATAAANAVAQIFRAENSLARRPNPDPVYFSKQPELELVSIPNFDTTESKNLLDEQRKLVTNLVNEAQNIRQKIEKAFNQDFDYLSPISNQFNREN